MTIATHMYIAYAYAFDIQTKKTGITHTVRGAI